MPESEEVLKALLGFSIKQWVVIGVIVTSAVGGAFWVEDRYAKIKETDERFEKNQQQLESAYFLTLEMFELLPDDRKRAILEKLTLSQATKKK